MYATPLSPPPVNALSEYPVPNTQPLGQPPLMSIDGDSRCHRRLRCFAVAPKDGCVREVGDPAIPLTHVAVNSLQRVSSKQALYRSPLDCPARTGLLVVIVRLAETILSHFQV